MFVRGAHRGVDFVYFFGPRTTPSSYSFLLSATNTTAQQGVYAGLWLLSLSLSPFPQCGSATIQCRRLLIDLAHGWCVNCVQCMRSTKARPTKTVVEEPWTQVRVRARLYESGRAGAISSPHWPLLWDWLRSLWVVSWP